MPDGAPHVFLHGEDCYALRCAVLHEGADDIVTQRARVALTPSCSLRLAPGGPYIAIRATPSYSYR